MTKLPFMGLFGLLGLLALGGTPSSAYLYPSQRHLHPHMHHGDRLIPTLFHQRLAVAARYGRTAIADEDDEYDEWDKKNPATISEEDASEEQPDPNYDPDDIPDLICQQKGPAMCTCTDGDYNVVDCDKAKLHDNNPLNTAFLSLAEAKGSDWKAHIVRLTHNDIEVLRRGQVMPGQEGNVLVLDFSFNRVSAIEPHAFDTFTNLRKLKLSHNHLRDEEMSTDWLTPELGASIHQLYLDWNYLVKLDKDLFGKLPNLRKLVLDGNNGLVLNKQMFKNLTKLKTLSLDKCGLKSLPDDLFENLPELEELSLSGNPLTSLPLKALESAPKLSILALSETPFNNIPAYAFKEVPSLTKIYFRKMDNLVAVSDCAFCRLPHLVEVDFTKSPKLAAIHKNAFGGSSDKEHWPDAMQSLLLEGCALNTLDKDVADWSSMTRFTLVGNPWDCSCELAWLISSRKLLKKTRSGVEEPMCANESGDLAKLPFSEVKDHLDCAGDPNHAASGMEKTTIVLILLGLCGAVVGVGFFVVKKRGGGSPLPAFFQRQPADSQLGYANLPNQRRAGAAAGERYEEGDDEEDADERRLERDFNRPEFV